MTEYGSPTKFMHYFLKPLIRAMRRLNDSELKLAIIGGFLFSLAGCLDLLIACWGMRCRGQCSRLYPRHLTLQVLLYLTCYSVATVLLDGTAGNPVT